MEFQQRLSIAAQQQAPWNRTLVNDLGADSCPSFRNLNSTYNSNAKVPSYTGIMFEIVALNDIEILSLELDVTTMLNNMPVEIFTLQGSFESFTGYPDAWNLVADTELVLAPEGTGAIVPVADFKPIQLPARSRQSFYITMAGPYLDHNVNALDKTGDQHTKNSDILMFVGAGTHDYKFPEKMDKVLNPKFAGVIHYRVDRSCDEIESTTTTVEYNFLTNQDRGSLFVAFEEALVKFYETKIQESLRNNIAKPVASRPVGLAFTGTCPFDWRDCPNTYLQVKVSVPHSSILSRGEVLFEFLNPQLIQDIQREVPKQHKILYLGQVSVAASFSIHLDGVEPVTLPDQFDYFRSVLLTFLQETVNENDMSVLGVVVTTDRKEDRSLRRTQSTGSITTMTGVVQGSLSVGNKPKKFRFALEDAFQENTKLYQSLMLETGKLRPGHKSWMTFSGLQHVTAEFENLDLSINNSSSKSMRSRILGSVFGSIAGVSLMLCLFFLYRHKKEQAKTYRELEEYREEKRKERKAKRAESTRVQQEPKDGEAPIIETEVVLAEVVLERDGISCILSPRENEEPAISRSPRPEVMSGAGSTKPISRTNNSEIKRSQNIHLNRHLERQGGNSVRRTSSAFSIGSYSAATGPSRLQSNFTPAEERDDSRPPNFRSASSASFSVRRTPSEAKRNPRNSDFQHTRTQPNSSSSIRSLSHERRTGPPRTQSRVASNQDSPQQSSATNQKVTGDLQSPYTVQASGHRLNKQRSSPAEERTGDFIVRHKWDRSSSCVTLGVEPPLASHTRRSKSQRDLYSSAPQSRVMQANKAKLLTPEKRTSMSPARRKWDRSSSSVSMRDGPPNLDSHRSRSNTDFFSAKGIQEQNIILQTPYHSQTPKAASKYNAVLASTPGSQSTRKRVLRTSSAGPQGTVGATPVRRTGSLHSSEMNLNFGSGLDSRARSHSPGLLPPVLPKRVSGR